MSALGWAVVGVPAAGAVGLALLRRGGVAGWAALAAAGVTLALAAALARWPEAAAHLLVDGLAAHVAVLVALAGLLGAWFARKAMSGAARAMAALAGLELAVLSDAVPLAWAGLGVAVLAVLLGGAGGGEAAWRALRAVLPALGLALLGALVLGQAGGGMAGWAGLAEAAPGLEPGLVSLGWILLLAGLAPVAGLAPLHGWMGAVRGTGAALLPALGAVALLVLLRGRQVVMAHPDAVVPGPPLLALGLASLGWAALGLWRGGHRPVRDAMLFQGGLAAVAFGLGGAEAMAAGLLLLSASVVLGPVAAGGGRIGALALAALALLPPFATFGAGLALLAEAGFWLALPLAGLVAAGAGGLVRAALGMWRRPQGRDWRAEIPGALVLALAVAAGAVPWVGRWFAQLGEGL